MRHPAFIDDIAHAAGAPEAGGRWGVSEDLAILVLKPGIDLLMGDSRT
jgi:hypothetical protein